MGDNPSHFKDDPANPVEQVSWDDVQTFLDRLNALVPGLAAGLPSEAQWENACRAGTTTPSPSARTSRRSRSTTTATNPTPTERRPVPERTVPVKSSRPTRGAVRDARQRREWCADWYGDYPKAADRPVRPAGGRQARAARRVVGPAASALPTATGSGRIRATHWLPPCPRSKARPGRAGGGAARGRAGASGARRPGCGQRRRRMAAF
jgi:formylglycine-generating enzyme required for sulfatase activity